MNEECMLIRSRFMLGDFRITKAADEKISRGDTASGPMRHAQGDWGDVSEEERAANETALQEGGRLVSVYQNEEGVKYSFVTEADRSDLVDLIAVDRVVQRLPHA